MDNKKEFQSEAATEKEQARQAQKDDLEYFGKCSKIRSLEKWDSNKTTILTPVKAMREKCLDCCAGNSQEVALCTCRSCSLFPYRFGKIPGFKYKLSPEQRTECRLRAKKARQIHKN